MSSLETSISTLASRFEQHSATTQTEEAVKTSFVLPFLQCLGYDVFNPGEVIPEFTADVPGKRGEKVDYAIMRDGEVSILIECKGLGGALSEKHAAQLHRYFHVTKARFSILTNGREYRFFSDLEEPNKMDSRPFFVFDLLDRSVASITELQRFEKANFDVASILQQAERLKYSSVIKRMLESWMESPPEGLIRLAAGEVYDGRLNAATREMLSRAVSAAFKELVRDKVRLRLSSALDEPVPVKAEQEATEVDDGIETTPEEIEGWLTVKSLLRGSLDVSRVTMRDAKSYCAILLDNNNRKPLARLHFNRSQKYIGLFDGEGEERMPIETLDDLLDLKERLVATSAKYS